MTPHADCWQAPIHAGDRGCCTVNVTAMLLGSLLICPTCLPASSTCANLQTCLPPLCVGCTDDPCVAMSINHLRGCVALWAQHLCVCAALWAQMA